MSEPHRHHFVPAFYLRQWHGPDEKLVEYTIKHRKLIPKPVSAEATGFQRDLYEFRELPSPLSQFLEKEFFTDERPDRLDQCTYLADQAVRRGQRHQIPERFSSAKRSTDCGSDQRGSSRPGTTLRVGDQPVALAGDVHPRPHEHEAGEAAVLPVARKLPRT
jgi:hypothetical protein